VHTEYTFSASASNSLRNTLYCIITATFAQLKCSSFRVLLLLVATTTHFSAACTTVPHVSAMSSTRIATLPFTSPTSTIDATSLAFLRSLWISAKSMFNLSAIDVTLCKQQHVICFPIHASLNCNVHIELCENSPFCTASIGRNDHTVSPLGNIVFDPLKHSWFCKQVVDRNIKKSLEIQKKHHCKSNTCTRCLP
jgi:hypothetical protein